MLSDVVDLLACPLCKASLTLDAALRCPSGHSFDVARQGYASLLRGDAKTGTADTAEMVAARAAFLSAGHYLPLAEALAGYSSGDVLDAGAGTGYYLAAALGSGRGVALDISKFALRRAAKAHPRVGAVVADLWRDLPIRSESVRTVLNVFAPRNAAEFRRVLRPDGLLIVATPTPSHLAELRGPLGLISVDEQKEDRLAETLGAAFAKTDTTTVTIPLTLDPAETATLIGMSPSSRHIAPAELSSRIASLGAVITATAEIRVAAYAPSK